MKLFKGRFNYQGEIHEFWTKAHNQDKAFTNFVCQLGEVLGIRSRKMYVYFKMDKRPKYEIKEVER